MISVGDLSPGNSLARLVALMDRRQNPFLLSFPAGTWLATSVRVSIFFPLLLLVVCINLGLVLGLIVCGLLLLSVLVHEFFHVLAARGTGGEAEEIILWPAGGLAMCEPAPTFRSEFLTTAAGPLANLLLAVGCLPMVLGSDQFAAAFHPVVLPALRAGGTSPADLFLLLFAINLKLIYLNLLPVYPMDGGRMLTTVCSRWWDPFLTRQIAMWAGVVTGVLMALVGLCISPEIGIHLVFLGGMVLILNLYDAMQRQTGESYDDSFLGYDFSQGYTSLERDEGREPPRRRPGLIAQWRKTREEKRRLREQQQRLETEARLDELLDKVHAHGMDSLTEAEKGFLKRASTQYRSGEK